MTTYKKHDRIPAVPTDEGIFYPEEDGKPMADSDLHRRILVRTLDVIEAHFKRDASVYVSGDILMYYVEGLPEKVVAPDVLVTFGIGKKRRRNYKVWEEGKIPDFAMEFSSKHTYRNDLDGKLKLYNSLGIRDYFLYDAEGLYLPWPLMGYTLVDGVYSAIPAGESGGLRSSSLNLDFHAGEEGLGIYDPVAGTWLQTPAESASARAEQEAVARREAEACTEQEAAARREAEACTEQEAAARREAEARAEGEAAARREAEARAEGEAAARREADAARQKEAAARQEEASARQKADAEILQLREELARLRSRR